MEEKIFQRQLSKEGLQSVVDDKEQVNSLSTKDLRNLFKLRLGTPSDTHDKLRCERCKIIADKAEDEAAQLLPQKLGICKDLIEKMLKCEDAPFFTNPLRPEDHGVSLEVYEQRVKQPVDLGTIHRKLTLTADQPQAYTSVSGFSKDVNRIFSNVSKVWAEGDDIAGAALRLHKWWISEWTSVVPALMSLRPCSEVEDGNDQPTFANERGECFQEQIGLPDEENMRNWSHHYSTDTVDDPIFRAAMKGYGSVSFVFGLEVTWSLIQQRQQEESERKALQELEAQCAPVVPDEVSTDDEQSDLGDSAMDEVDQSPPAGQPGNLDGSDEENHTGKPTEAESTVPSFKECLSCTFHNKRHRKTCEMCGVKLPRGKT